MNSEQYDQIQTLEELSLNALPCLQQILDDGWVLRLAEGYTKRANSVTPLYFGSQDLRHKIKRCEEVYRHFKLKPIFRLANIPRLETLDQTLEQLGYQKQDSVSVRVKTITDSDMATSNSLVTFSSELSEEWLDHFVHADNLPFQHWDTLSTMLEIVPNPTCYAWLKDRYRFCSCARGVLERNYLGIFNLVTAKKQRHQGYATDLIYAMLKWGKINGAIKAYVQVETQNQVAINLYNKLGFTEVYQYFYYSKL